MYVTIKTNDEKLYKILRKNLQLSETLVDLMEDVQEIEHIPLLSVDSKTFEKISEYLDYHTKNPDEHEKYKNTGLREISPWDYNFCCQTEHKLLQKVIIAADYLYIQPLIDVIAKYFATLIQGKTIVEVEDMFSDLTPI